MSIRKYKSERKSCASSIKKNELACNSCNARIVFNFFLLLFSDFNLQKNNKNKILNNNQTFFKLLNKLDHDKLFVYNIYCFPKRLRNHYMILDMSISILMYQIMLKGWYN